MNSIGKMGRGQWAYYQDQVALGREDYYAAGAARPGRWQGRGAEQLGLSGHVEAEDVARVFNGLDPRHPHDERPLIDDPRWKVPGYDLTFMAAKSVSVLWAMSDADTRRRIDRAVDRSNEGMLAWLEDKIGHGRTTDGHGRTVRVRGQGLTVATYAHTVSRNLDPHLHRHNLILNVVERPNSRGELVMGALDGRLLYAYARPAGFIGQRLLRQELTRELGVRWTRELELHFQSVESAPGVMEIKGLHDREVLLAYSTRHEQIQEQLQAMGYSGARAAEQAVLATRPAKSGRVDPQQLEERWTTIGESVGFGPATMRDAFGHSEQLRPATEADLEMAFARLESAAGLTRANSTFNRRDVVMALCEALPQEAELDPPQLDELAQGFLGERAVYVGTAGQDAMLRGCDVIRTADSVRASGADAERYTTREILNTEIAGLSQALSAPALEAPLPGLLDAVIERRRAGLRPLSEEQKRALCALASGRDRVNTLLGEAGTGKTAVIEGLREVREAEGRRVIGLALSARATQQLRNAGIQAIDLRTIASWKAWLEAGAQLPEAATVVVDEAGMVGTRDLVQIQQRVLERGGELVLVGDDEQLAEIDAGGYFRGLHRRLAEASPGYRPSHELHQVLRQQDPRDVEALRALRVGEAQAALHSLDRRGRIFEGENAMATERAMLTDWLRCHRQGKRTLMLARSRQRVHGLNALAQALRLEDGELSHEQVPAAGDQVLRAGDRIRFRQANHELGVINGTQGSVEQVDPERGTALVRYKTREAQEGQAWLGQEWLQGVRRDGIEHVQLDYASTVNLAQGATTEVGLAFVSDDADRQWAYVALSRHQEEVRVYTVAEPQWLENSRQIMHGRVARPEPRGRLAGVTEAMSRDVKKELAADGLEAAIQERIDDLMEKRLLLGELNRTDLRQLSSLQSSQLRSRAPIDPFLYESSQPQADLELDLSL